MVLRCDRRDVGPAKQRINHDCNKRIIIINQNQK